jgi:uncharacterized protein YndB with AHSA1/START domain
VPGLNARAKVGIDAATIEVWDALIDPDRVEQYMFGTRVATDWEVGGPITWSGEWQGNQYEDRGEILEFQPERRLVYTHYSPLSGESDRPENRHTVAIDLASNGMGTTVTLTQDNNQTEETRGHSEANWQSMLDSLKEHLEAGIGPGS